MTTTIGLGSAISAKAVTSLGPTTVTCVLQTGHMVSQTTRLAGHKLVSKCTGTTASGTMIAVRQRAALSASLTAATTQLLTKDQTKARGRKVFSLHSAKLLSKSQQLFITFVDPFCRLRRRLEGIRG